MGVPSVLRARLAEALDRLAPHALLLSGGVDSGLLASLRPELEGIAVSLDSLSASAVRARETSEG